MLLKIGGVSKTGRHLGQAKDGWIPFPADTIDTCVCCVRCGEEVLGRVSGGCKCVAETVWNATAVDCEAAEEAGCDCGGSTEAGASESNPGVAGPH